MNYDLHYQRQQELENLIREMDEMANDISSYVGFLAGRQSVLGEWMSPSLSNNN